MSGTFFLIPHWGFETKENTNNGESTEESASKNRSNHTEISKDKKSINSSFKKKLKAKKLFILKILNFPQN